MNSQVIMYNPSNYVNELNKDAYARIKKQNFEIKVINKVNEIKMLNKLSERLSALNAKSASLT